MLLTASFLSIRFFPSALRLFKNVIMMLLQLKGVEGNVLATVRY